MHDGTTPGGFSLARADLANISDPTLQGRITNKEEIGNKVSEIDENATHEQYPDARAVYAKLLLKANCDLDNLSDTGMNLLKSLGIAETVETGSDNTFAFKLGNGYVIQGGYSPRDNSAPQTVSLSVEMADTNYLVIGSVNERNSEGYTFNVFSKSTTDFGRLFTFYENSHYWATYILAFSWLVIGKYKQQTEEDSE